MTKQQFKICFDQYFDQIRNFLYYRCGDSDIATDITQETFMKIWEKDLEFDQNRIKGLLYKIARELWITQYRKNETAYKYQLSFNADFNEDDAQKNLEYLELKKQYEKTLNTLPNKQKEVFLMSRMDELTYKEIAERLNISVKAVEKRMNIALSILRKELAYEN